MLPEDPEHQLDFFLAKYLPEIEEQAREVRAKLRERLTGAVEMVYDNYNALVIGYVPNDRPSDAILSFVVNPEWVTICFLQGTGLHDPDGILAGSGNQVRHIRLRSAEDLDQPQIAGMIAQAMRKALVPLDPSRPHQITIRAVAEKQRPRRPKEKLRKVKKVDPA